MLMFADTLARPDSLTQMQTPPRADRQSTSGLFHILFDTSGLELEPRV